MKYAPACIALEVVAPARLGDAICLPDGMLIFTDTNANGFGRRFYRSRIIE